MNIYMYTAEINREGTNYLNAAETELTHLKES